MWLKKRFWVWLGPAGGNLPDCP